MMRIRVAALARSFTLNLEKANRQLEYRPRNLLQDALTEFADSWRLQEQSTADIVS
jgi:hypothetical protein